MSVVPTTPCLVPIMHLIIAALTTLRAFSIIGLFLQLLPYVSPVSGLQGRGRQLVSITRWGPLSEGTALGSHCSLEWGIAEAACSAPVPELKFGGWAPSQCRVTIYNISKQNGFPFCSLPSLPQSQTSLISKGKQTKVITSQRHHAPAFMVSLPACGKIHTW